MLKKTRQANGYILVLTMIIMSMLVILVTRMFFSSSIFSTFAAVAVQREQAKMLAQAGTNIACGQLYVPAKSQEKTDLQEPGKPKEQIDLNKKLLEQIIPIINTWQTVKFDKATNGVDGTVRFYITCEEGKLHLNDLLTIITDPKLLENKRAFYQAILTKTASINNINANLFTSAVDFFEKRKHIWLNDSTELLTERGFDQFLNNIFVTPAQKDKKTKDAIYLIDLFTMQSRYGKLDPWVLSKSMCLTLGIAHPEDNTINDRLKTAFKSYKKNYNWSSDWDAIFKPVYNISFAALGKEIVSLLPGNNEPFNPVAFSVTAYATVGKITHGVCALLLRRKQQDQSVAFIPIKSYWI